MKPKILHIVSSLGMGGAETWLVELVKFIKANNVPIQFEFLVSNGQKDFFDQELIELGCKIHYIKLDKKNILKFILEFRKLLKKETFKAIHSHQDFLSGWYFLFGVFIPIDKKITHIHNPSYQIKNNYGINLRRKLNISLGKVLIYFLATDITSTSKKMISEYGFDTYFFSKLNPRPVHCSFDFKKFESRLPNHENLLRQQFNLAITDKIILFAGRLDYSLMLDDSNNHKNSAFALYVTQKLVEKNVNYKVIFIGKNNHIIDEFKQLIKELGIEKNVIIAGVRKDIQSFMHISDILLFPSREEGLGMVAVEAQVAKLNVLASYGVPQECVFINEIVHFEKIENGYTRWAEKIDEIVKNKIELSYKYYNEKCQTSNFNIKNNINELIELYT